MSVTITAFAAQATSVAVTAVTAGDLLVVTAHRDGSTTPPTLPAGFTTLDGPTGANTNSHQTGFKVCDGTETTSGTWTNATSVVASLAHATAGELLGIGAHSPNGGASTSVGWLALTLQVIDGSSVVLLHGAHRSATDVGATALSPSSLTSDASATDCAAFHSGSVSTWAAQTEAVNANSGWRTEVVEITVAVASTAIQRLLGGNTLTSAHAAINIELPNPTLAGNTLVLWLGWAVSTGTPTLSVSDNQGNTWETGPTDTDTVNGYTLSGWVMRGVAAGTKTVTITATGGTIFFLQDDIQEYPHISTAAGGLETSAHTHATSATWSPTSMTTTTDGDLIVAAAVDASGSSPFGVFAPGAGFHLMGTDLRFGICTQQRLQQTHGAIDAALTASKSTAYIACAMALKPDATAGALPTQSPRVIAVNVVNIAAATGTSFSQQFARTGNCTLVGWQGASGAGATRAMSALADGNGNTYTLLTGVGSGLSGLVQWGYVVAPTVTENDLLTITTTADNLSTAVLYDLVGVSAFDTSANATGLQADGGNLTTVSLTPGGTGVVLAMVGINSHTIKQLTGTGYDAVGTWTLEGTSGSGNEQEDNGWGHIYTGAATTFVWTNTGAGVGGGVQDWASQAISFLGTSGSGTVVSRAVTSSSASRVGSRAGEF